MHWYERAFNLLHEGAADETTNYMSGRAALGTRYADARIEFAALDCRSELMQDGLLSLPG